MNILLRFWKKEKTEFLRMNEIKKMLDILSL